MRKSSKSSKGKSMKLRKPGKSISDVEIRKISKKGFWMDVRGKKLFLSHQDFPWFQSATSEQISKVTLLHEHHLYWPDLDVDLELESLKDLKKYPLVAN